MSKVLDRVDQILRPDRDLLKREKELVSAIARLESAILRGPEVLQKLQAIYTQNGGKGILGIVLGIAIATFGYFAVKPRNEA